MRAIHPITASTTVNTIVAAVYDVIDPTTGSVDTDRRDGAARALRALNPTLPADESTVTSGTTPYVLLRRIPRSPWRLPSATSTLRTALEALKIYNVDTIARMSSSVVLGLVGGSYTLTNINRMRGIARLMRVSGMDETTATYLYDHSTTPITSPGELAAASAATIKTLVSALVTSGFPSALSAAKPWNIWPRHARKMTQRRRTRAMSIAPTPLRSTLVGTECARWTIEGKSGSRTDAGRKSAKAISSLYSIQQAWLKGNEALSRRDARTAWQQYRRVWRLLGEESVARGIISGSSSQATGPSVSNVVTLCGKILDELDEMDIKDAATRLTPHTNLNEELLGGFRVGDLQTTPSGTVDTALRPYSAYDLGLRGINALSRSFSERARGTLGASIAQGLLTPNNAGRSVDFDAHDKAQLSQNLASVQISSLQDNEGTAWTAARSNFTLRDVRAKVGTSLDSGGVTPMASAVLSSTVAAKFPSSLISNMTPFERYVTFVPSGKRSSAPRYIPISPQFKTRYIADVLSSMLGEGDMANWSVKSTDLSDPARFAFLLPQICMRQLPMAMGRAQCMMGKTDIGYAILSCVPSTTSNLSTRLDYGLSDLVSMGILLGQSIVVDCDEFDESEEVMYQKLHELNLAGDAAYQKGQYMTAAYKYEKVLAVVAQCADSTAGTLSVNWVDLHADVLDRVQMRDRDLNPYSVLEYTVVDPTDADISTDLFGSVIIWETTDWLATDYDTSISALFTRSINLNSSRYQLYDLETDPVSFESEDSSGDVTDEEDEELGLDEGVEFLPPTPGGPGGGYIPPTCGGGGTTTTTPVCFDTDRILAEAMHASTYLEQLKAGLNWLGFDPNTTPPWRYSVLLEKARYFASKADEIQSRSLSILTQAEDQYLQELQALLNEQIAVQGVEVAQAQYEVAVAQVEAAEASLNAAEAQAERAEDDEMWAWIGVGAAVVAAVVVTVATFGAGAPVGAVAVASAVGAVAGASASVAGSAQQVDNAKEGKEAADDQVEVAEAQVASAEAQEASALEQVALAELEAAAAAAISDATTGQETNTVNLYDLLAEIERIGTSYLRMANRLAWLSERAYQWETRRSSQFIQMCYEKEGSFQARFASAATLLSHLDALEHARITSARDRYQLLKTTFSLAAHDPCSLLLLQAKGRCLFRITQQQLDERFPGLYLHSLRRMEVEIDGLIPASGVTGVLRTANNTLVRVPNTSDYVQNSDATDYDWAYPESDYEIGGTNAPAFVMKPLQSVGFTQMLSEYRMSKDGGILSPPEGVLDTFEHMGIDGLWTLELPRTGNGFDYGNVTDVRFVLYFTGQYDGNLAARQVEELTDTRVARSTVLPATQYAASSFSTFVTEPSDTDFRDVRLLSFELDDGMLPANLKTRYAQNMVALFVQEGTNPITLHVRATPRPVPAAATADYDSGTDGLDGMVYSAVDDADITIDSVTYYTSREGHFPALDSFMDAIDAGSASPQDVTGSWVLKVLPEDNSDLCLKDEDGDDVVVTTGEIDLAAGGSASFTGGDWQHVSVVARVRVDAGTLRIRVRDDGAGHYVYADINTTGLTLADTTSATTSLTAACLVAAEWTEVKLTVASTTATLSLDGVDVLTLTVGLNAAGTVTFLASGSGADIVLSDVRATRLSYDGTELEDVVSETFSVSGAPDWTLGTGASWASATHKVLDLSFLQEVILQLDYTAVFDFLA